VSEIKPSLAFSVHTDFSSARGIHGRKRSDQEADGQGKSRGDKAHIG